LALQAASSDTSTSTTATIQASYAIVPDFFNGLLGEHLSPFKRRSRAHHLSRPASPIASLHRSTTLFAHDAHLACRFLWNTGSANHA